MRLTTLLWIVLFLFTSILPASAQKSGERPPSPVVTAKVTTGEVVPQGEFIGTVYFTEISDVASEVDGKAVSVNVEDGQRVKAGDVLVQLSSDILDRRIANARALQAQAKADFELAKLENQRTSTLFKSKTVAEGEYDTKRLNAEAKEKTYFAATATLRQQLIEREKKNIRAPFDGVVIERKVDRGEWVSQGTTVVVVARDDEFDVVVNAPARSFSLVKPGMKLTVHVDERELPGRIFAVVPKGDVATRSFPVKIRVNNPGGAFAEGMEARVSLPRDAGGRNLVVPRDAVISSRGQLVVWAVLDGKAVPFPVMVVGYRGLDAGVKSDKLKPGMEVVIKGNERLMPGQSVAPAAAGDK